MPLASLSPPLKAASPFAGGVSAPSHAPASAPGGGVAWEAMAGRLTEVATAAGGGLSVATALVQQAQRLGEPVAWVQWDAGNLYPPDMAAAGVQLEALLVVHAGSAGQTQPRLRAAELLLRSGGFGLVVVDLSSGVIPAGLAWQHRLQAWARQHHAVVLLLTAITEKTTASLGALIALQIVPEITALGAGRFVLRCQARKNKLGMAVAGWDWARVGPPGLGG